jgi:hypothetical protein
MTNGDLAVLVVAQAGRLVVTGNGYEPDRIPMPRVHCGGSSVAWSASRKKWLG